MTSLLKLIGGTKAMLIIGALILTTLGAGWLYVSKLVSDRDDLRSQLVTLTGDKTRLEATIETIHARHNSQMAQIKALEKARLANSLLIEPFLGRIDQLPTIEETSDASKPPISFADRLNGINADLNRVLEQTGR